MTYTSKGSLTTVGILFPALALGLLVLRVFHLRQHGRPFAIDDGFIIAASIFTMGTGITVAVGAQLGIVGGHSSPTPVLADSLQLAKFEYAFWIVHVWTIGIIKLAILFLFRRLFRGRSHTTIFDCANWFMIVCVMLWTLLFFFLYVFESGVHPSLGWTSAGSVRQRPFDTWGMATGGAVASWIMDLYILIEPLCMIGTLQMKLRQKVQCSMVFICSSLAVIAGLLRMIIIIQLFTQGVEGASISILGENFSTSDAKGIVSTIVFWTCIEIGVGFAVACAPSCAQYVDKLSINPIVTRIRSLSSLISIRAWSRASRSRSQENSGADRSPSRETSTTAQRKSPASRGSDDVVELAALPDHHAV